MVSDTVTIPKEEYERMKKELETLNRIKRELENMNEGEKPVSLKGMATILVSYEELEEAIKEAKSSLSKGAKDGFCN